MLTITHRGQAVQNSFDRPPLLELRKVQNLLTSGVVSQEKQNCITMVTNYILYLVVDEHGKNPNRKCHTSFLISLCLYSSNLGTFWLKIEQFWPFEEISIFSNGGHLGYSSETTEPISTKLC
jgi:hypothetical protein